MAWWMDGAFLLVYLTLLLTSVTSALRGRRRLGLVLVEWYLIVYAVWELLRMSFALTAGRSVFSIVGSSIVLLLNAGMFYLVRHWIRRLWPSRVTWVHLPSPQDVLNTRQSINRSA